MENIDEMLTALRGAALAERQMASEANRKADMYEAEIRGIEAANAWHMYKAEMFITNPAMTALGSEFAPRVPSGANQRQPRRNIKALVNESLGQPRTFVLPSDPEGLARHIASEINCRPKQVLAILVKMAAVDDTRAKQHD